MEDIYELFRSWCARRCLHPITGITAQSRLHSAELLTLKNGKFKIVTVVGHGLTRSRAKALRTNDDFRTWLRTLVKPCTRDEMIKFLMTGV